MIVKVQVAQTASARQQSLQTSACSRVAASKSETPARRNGKKSRLQRLLPITNRIVLLTYDLDLAVDSCKTAVRYPGAI